MEVEKDIISPFIRKQFSLWLWDWGDCLIIIVYIMVKLCLQKKYLKRLIPN